MSEIPRKIISRDEMNLAEFPLTVLSTRANPNLKTLEFSDSIRTKNGDLVERKWLITGADKFGLPTSSDDEVLLGLLKLTVDDGITRRKVHFTRYELLRTLRWSTEGRSYTRLQKALDRLAGLRIKATNAFFDNDAKSHSTKVFGLIDAYEINTSRDTDLKSSYFTWSETIFKSFQVGFIKKLDLDFYLSLHSAVSKRLYRFLDKHFWYRSCVDINLFTLSHEKLGISRNYKFASSLRQQLDPALKELCEQGFLETFSFSGKGSETRLSMVAKRGVRSVTKQDEKPSKTNSLTNSPSLVQEMMGQLIARGIKERQVLKLLAGQTEDALRHIQRIIAYFDALVETGSHLVNKSPVGFLYRAIENHKTFTVPKRIPQTARAVTVSRRTRLDIEKEIEASLSKIRPHLSANNYQKVLDHAVNERMQKEGIV